MFRVLANYAGYKPPVDIRTSPVLISSPEDARRNYQMTGGKVVGAGNG